MYDTIVVVFILFGSGRADWCGSICLGLVIKSDCCHFVVCLSCATSMYNMKRITFSHNCVWMRDWLIDKRLVNRQAIYQWFVLRVHGRWGIWCICLHILHMYKNDHMG